MRLVFSVVMMMNATVNEEGEGERNAEERTAAERVTVREDERNKSKRWSLRSTERPCASAAYVRRRSLACAYVQRPRCCNQHTLGCITRRDLYSRLTSLCEGRIRSDTSLVCTHGSTVRLPPIFSLPLYLPVPLPSSGFLRGLVRSFVRPVVSL